MDERGEGTAGVDHGKLPEQPEQLNSRRSSLSEDGPGFIVPRFVWQASFAMSCLIGIALLSYVFGQLDPYGSNLYASEPSFMGSLSVSLVGAVFVAGWLGGTSRLIKWLYGPLPKKKS